MEPAAVVVQKVWWWRPPRRELVTYQPHAVKQFCPTWAVEVAGVCFAVLRVRRILLVNCRFYVP